MIMAVILTMGRGGTGKTSFTALMARHLVETGQGPILLADLDPDMNLAEMVGVDLEKEGVKTVSELIADTFIGRGGTTVGIAPRERMEQSLLEKGLFEGTGFDLMVVGTKWLEGCYCMPDAALKSALQVLMANYRHVLIDSPAGLEHLNRKVTSNVDDLFDVIGPSSKSFAHVDRAIRIIREVKITVNHFHVIASYLFPEGLVEEAESRGRRKILGRIATDPLLAAYVLAGRSLMELPETSPAFESVRNIMRRAGY
jgi:CO dehydrogenase maturation factor